MSKANDPDEVLNIKMPRSHWAALVEKLRNYGHIEQGEGLQLGRLPWMVVMQIEGRIAGIENPNGETKDE